MSSAALSALPAHVSLGVGSTLVAGKSLPLGGFYAAARVADALPDGGLPCGAVVEVAAPLGLGTATSFAFAACASAQAAAKLTAGAAAAGAWCAWVAPAVHDGVRKRPSSSLYAPAAERAGINLERLLVVCPPYDALARIAVRVATSRVFSVVVVDAAGVPGCRARQRLDVWPTVVRRLAIACENSDTTILLLTDRLAPRSMTLPVAMRIELGRPALDRLTLHVAKDRRGRVTNAQHLPLSRSA